MKYDYDKLREYIKRCKWNWATSMIDVPHEYIHRDHCALSRDEFYYFVSAQRQDGIPEWWGQYHLPYLHIDGYKYWTMGDPFETTWILNRQKVFNEFDMLEWPVPRIYSASESDIMVRTILSTFKDKKIFEVGIGNGDFVTVSNIKPELYYGVDPSKKAIQRFRGSTNGYYRRCATISFEEAVKKWLSADSVVIALFGTASYLMHQYLRKLNESGLDYCMTFYREDYSPEEFKDMHHFPYSKSEIRSMFPKANLYNHEKFITVSSKKLLWQQTTIENDLFSV
jgi:hypothetical protein